MARTVYVITFLCFAIASGLAAEKSAESQSDSQPRICSEVVTKIIAGIHADVAASGLPFVEIRRCPEAGRLQAIAWQPTSGLPPLVVNLHRFSIGPVLMNGNVFAVVATGGYDTVLVLQYRRGRPEAAFTDSTHANIVLTNRSDELSVEIGSTTERARMIRNFKVDEDELKYVR